MNFQQIKDALGKKGEIGEGFYEEEINKFYYLSIEMDNYTLSFDGSKDGVGGTKIMCYDK